MLTIFTKLVQIIWLKILFKKFDISFFVWLMEWQWVAADSFWLQIKYRFKSWLSKKLKIAIFHFRANLKFYMISLEINKNNLNNYSLWYDFSFLIQIIIEHFDIKNNICLFYVNHVDFFSFVLQSKLPLFQFVFRNRFLRID